MNNKKIIILVLSSILFTNTTYSEEITKIEQSHEINKESNILKNTQEEDAVIKSILDDNFEYPHYEVGAAFLSGKRLPKNIDKAVFWLARSSEFEKNDKADYLLAEIYSRGFSNNNIPLMDKAMFFYERSASRGNEEGMLKSAFNFLYNDSVFNQEKGVYWLNQAMIKGNLTALQLNSFIMLTEDDGNTILKRLDFIDKSSQKGDNLSSMFMGLLYLKGEILPRDFIKSKTYFLASMRQGNILAEDFLFLIDKTIIENKKKEIEEIKKIQKIK